jgi:(S)-2-hydroxy-acid oxidase
MDSLASVKDFERIAADNLPKAAYDYYRSGANGSVSLKDNEDKFKDIHLKTSVFAERKKDAIKLDTTILGHKVKTPICIASTAFHRMATQEGELATARAA